MKEVVLVVWKEDLISIVFFFRNSFVVKVFFRVIRLRICLGYGLVF